jgi:hypothetical protein
LIAQDTNYYALFESAERYRLLSGTFPGQEENGHHEPHSVCKPYRLHNISNKKFEGLKSWGLDMIFMPCIEKT